MFYCDNISSEREGCKMSLGERIRFFRKRNKWTQVELGEKMGFTGTTANIRVAQYEWNRRMPKQDVIEEFAKLFDVAPEALQNPDTYLLFRIQPAIHHQSAHLLKGF